MADIGWEGVVSILCVVTALFVLFKDWAGADFVFLGHCNLADWSEALLSLQYSIEKTHLYLISYWERVSKTSFN